MRPHPPLPSPRRTLATLAALLLAATLSLGWYEPSAAHVRSERCEPVKVSTSVPVGLLQSCSGVRPGAIISSDGATCTMNFLFTDGIRHYVGTAGHCVLDTPQFTLGSGRSEDVEQSWPAGTGPVALDAEGNRIGRFVYGLMQDPLDFSLVQLDRGVPFNPRMCHFGGPTGINDDAVTSGTQLRYYGNGVGVGTLVPARPAVSQGTSNDDRVSAAGIVLPGDSGAGVIDERGRAVGLVSTLGVGVGALELVGIPRIVPQIEAAERRLGVDLRLMTAPLN